MLGIRYRFLRPFSEFSLRRRLGSNPFVADFFLVPDFIHTFFHLPLLRQSVMLGSPLTDRSLELVHFKNQGIHSRRISASTVEFIVGRYTCMSLALNIIYNNGPMYCSKRNTYVIFDSFTRLPSHLNRVCVAVDFKSYPPTADAKYIVAFS